jgi:hypothetical protein
MLLVNKNAVIYGAGGLPDLQAAPPPTRNRRGYVAPRRSGDEHLQVRAILANLMVALASGRCLDIWRDSAKALGG